MSNFPRDFGMYLGEISAADVGKRNDCKQVSKSISLRNVKKYLPNQIPIHNELILMQSCEDFEPKIGSRSSNSASCSSP